jgi:hypothetical protein
LELKVGETHIGAFQEELRYFQEGSVELQWSLLLFILEACIKLEIYHFFGHLKPEIRS